MKYIKPINRSNVWRAPIFHSPYSIFHLTLSFFLFTACPEPPTSPPKRDTTIHLEVVSTFTTSARLHISVEDTTAEWTFGLTRNGEDILTATVYNSDTTITDNGLNPGTQYNYQAQWLEDGIAVDSSLDAIAQTMDTTSHNFTWEIDTLGEYGSYLKDVWIVDENNIWVVGYIKNGDSTYNSAHWDGNEWELIKVLSGHTANTGIQYFSENDIWVTSGIPIHWNGQEWTYYHLWDMGVLGPNDGGVTEIWGTSSSNIYFAGRNGSIVHYDGSTFTKMESSTGVDLEDIDGTEDGEHIFITGFKDSGALSGHSIALEIVNNTVETLFTSESYSGNVNSGDYGRFIAVDVFDDTVYYSTGGTDLLKYNWQDGGMNIVPRYSTSLGGIYNHDIEINALNDMAILGEQQFNHFNGIRLEFNQEFFDRFSDTFYRTRSIDYANDMAVIVGYGYINNIMQGFVVRGYHQ